MLNILPVNLRKKRRKYPLKKDEGGRSARRRAFEAFDRGLRPTQVTGEVDISLRTARRYHADWKKQPRALELRYQLAKEARKYTPEIENELVKALAAELDLPEETILERLQKPWGLKQLVRGDWNREIEAKRMTKKLARLESALQFLHLYEILKVPPERIKAVLDALEQEVRAERQSL